MSRLILSLVVVIAIIAIVNWFISYYLEIRTVIDNPENDEVEVVRNMVVDTPLVQNAKDVQQSCNQTIPQCLLKTAQVKTEQEVIESSTTE